MNKPFLKNTLRIFGIALFLVLGRLIVPILHQHRLLAEFWLTDQILISPSQDPWLYILCVVLYFVILIAAILMSYRLVWWLLFKGLLFWVGALLVVASGFGLFGLAFFTEPKDSSLLAHQITFGIMGGLMLAFGIFMLATLFKKR